MATRILNITSSNTWGDLIRALNNAINTINDIGFNDYTKEAGTLILSQPYANTITLSVSGNTSLETTAISGNVNIGQNLILSNTSQILIGPSTNNTATILLATNVTANDSIGVSVESTLDENVTTNYTPFKSSPKITNATFTLNDLTHFNATVTKLGSLCTIANNYGYFIDSDFAVGTYNYGFVSEIAAGANNWNIYASGTANNYIKGNLGLNTTTPSANLHIVGEQYIQSGSTQTALKISQEGTGHLLHFDNSISGSKPIVITANGSFIIGDVVSTKYNLPYDDTLTNYHFNYQQAGTDQLSGTAAIAYYGTKTGNQNGPALSFNRSSNTTLGVHGLVGSDYTLGSIGFAGSDGSKFVMGAGIRCDVDGIPVANSVPGKLIFSTTPIGANVSIDRMIIDSNGHIGISTIPEPGKLFSINKDITGYSSSYGISYDGEIKSDVTSYARLVYINPNVDDVAFTLNNLQYYTAEEGTFGELATITNQYGYYVGTLTGANNNYGFYSTIDEGEGNWNFYAAGNGANYFAGDIRFDKTISSTVGNKTINKNAGSVIIQSGNTNIIVTNSRVDANSVILTTVASIDANTKSATAVANTGFFTIYPNAIPTSNTRINFVIIN